jgi:HEPN domain-containing protein
MRRHHDWLRQAERDLRHARNATSDEDYEWACFAAQQAAEKAAKALVQYIGGEAWGHSVLMILKGLPDEHRPNMDILKSAAELDKLYIPTRYPNGFDMGIPGEYFDKEDAEKAIKDAERIVEYVRSKIT